MNEIARAAAALLILSLPAACSSPPPPKPTPPLAGARIGGPFTLTDQDGRQVSDRQFAGRYRIVYFGYTFCPDVCPAALQNIGAGLRLLEASDPAVAAKVVPIFITVDPARDTPPVVKAFVRAFHPRMVGLTGSPEAIARTAKEFAIYYAKGEPSADGGYMVNHSSQAYLMDPAGKPLALLPEEGPPQVIADEIRKWVS